jgi:Flp pilus assembly pilin Flp
MLLIPPFTPRQHPAERGRRERGQTTAEYALMLLAVATIAMLVVAWAGSTGRVGALLDAVFRSVTSMVR